MEESKERNKMKVKDIIRKKEKEKKTMRREKGKVIKSVICWKIVGPSLELLQVLFDSSSKIARC